VIKYILLALGLGVFAGYLNGNYGVVVEGWVSGYLFNISLVVLVFVMGFVFGADKEAVAKLRRTGLKVLVFPFAVALGSIVGGLIGGVILGVNVVGSMAVSAGFGWYTLAGPLVGQLFGAELGALGFVVNFLRELLTILTVSLVVRIDRYVPIAFGGATTMDTTLPVIVRYCGSETLITAFSNGFTLSVIVPIAITTIATLPH